jgi:enoyl-CoA hydratase/carnithine racemase
MTETPAFEDILYEKRDNRAAWIIINRPKLYNAFRAQTMEELIKAFQMAGYDKSVSSIVLTGAGDKAFCAGADLTAGAAAFNAAADEPTTDFGRLARLARTAGIPLIARVNGACVAGGMALMALCDLAIAAEGARFGLPEVKVGVFPMQVLVYLRAMIGARHVNELCLTGELITAARAREMGIVNQVTPFADLDAAVEAMIARFRAASPMALRRGKQAIFAMEGMAFAQAIAFAEAQIALASQSSDAREGFEAFNARRKPRWAAGAEPPP